MKTKDMKRSAWKRVRAKKQIIQDFTIGHHSGKISLLKIEEIIEPLIRHNGECEVVLADQGFYWLQLAVDRAHEWFTAMYDDCGRLLEIYVDITGGNNARSDNPSFDDLYLDYVISKTTVIELDRDELEDAFAAGEISREQFETAQIEGKRIYDDLRTNRDQIIAFFQTQFAILRPVLDGESQQS